MSSNSGPQEASMDNDIVPDRALPSGDSVPQLSAPVDFEDVVLADNAAFLEDVDTIHSSTYDPETGMALDQVASLPVHTAGGYSSPATDSQGSEPLDWFDNDDDEYLHSGGDGIADRMWKAPTKPVAAIFIHAGAGYHSTHNEHVHLAACREAAIAAMTLMHQGGTSVDAVEAAIKSLEDQEITNAGYGSNLSLEGKVECDATVVDQFGRSGACGATPNVKNPICLARLILDASNETLSLRRMPPNLLIGEGAKNFAFNHNIPLTPDEFLISVNSRERYQRWVEDLERAESVQAQYAEQSPCANDLRTHGGDHVAALKNATWNEGQPDSPQPDQQISAPELMSTLPDSPHSLPDATAVGPNGLTIPTLRNPLAASPMQSLQDGTGTPRGTKRRQDFSPPDCVKTTSGVPIRGTPTKPPSAAKKKSSRDVNVIMGVDGASHDPRVSQPARPKAPFFRPATASLDSEDAISSDAICDTVGAIAIDLHGNIASGSSSGGIGMKHSGRVGPAALVGIGSAVIPIDPTDVHGTAVAAVTSGTGEHMATTIASYKCAERLYHGTRRSSTGGDVRDRNDDAVLDSFVKRDFMDHPGVRNQPSQAAIGVMAVKQTRNGYYFYFAHNTDSFALCSMSSNEKEPLCVMSRIGEDRSVVARGGRKIRVD